MLLTEVGTYLVFRVIIDNQLFQEAQHLDYAVASRNTASYTRLTHGKEHTDNCGLLFVTTTVNFRDIDL